MGHIIARADMHANGVMGVGRAELPILIVSLRFSYLAHEELQCGLDYRELRCRVSPFDQTYIAHSIPKSLDVHLASGKELNNDMVSIEIPMDRTRLALLNRLRNGGDVRLRLDLELFVEELHQLGPLPNSPYRFIHGSVGRLRAQAQLQVVIQRSEWVERVLPGTGFAKAHIIELPAIPLQSCAGMASSFEALQQAQKLESQGFYDEAVSKCRIAIEPFIEQVDKTDEKGNLRKVPKLKAAWQTKLGVHTYEWLDACLRSVKGATNDAVHLSSKSFNQLEAQMLLMIVTALIAYAVKTQLEPE